MNNKSFVFDTNVLISATLLQGSKNALALDKAFLNGKVITSPDCFAEFVEVVFRKKFDKYFTDERRLQVIQKLERDGINVNLSITACRDPKDNKFLELAVTAGASCIITGDQDLLILHPFENIPIVSAADFLTLF
jgi:putative PIN family toxin of toxin-antitoxin system